MSGSQTGVVPRPGTGNELAFAVISPPATLVLDTACTRRLNSDIFYTEIKLTCGISTIIMNNRAQKGKVIIKEQNEF